MSGSDTGDVASLPAFAALDARAVLEQERYGASIQVDERYLRGQEAAIDSLQTGSTLARRRDIASQSRGFLDQVNVELGSLTEETLQTASTQLRDAFQQLPEFRYLDEQFPGECLVVPEWVRTGETIQYGTRIYLFRADDAPSPEEIVTQNVEAVVDGDRSAFERYQGELHGYPDCCVTAFAAHDRQDGTGPEMEAVESVTDCIDDGTLLAGDGPPDSIDDVVEGLFEDDRVYAFLGREFFPEPDCERASSRGRSIHETLREVYPEQLVGDYFRINVCWSYLMARATAAEGGVGRPPARTLGREHLLFHLPLSVTTTAPRYRGD